MQCSFLPCILDIIASIINRSRLPLIRAIVYNETFPTQKDFRNVAVAGPAQ